MSVSVTVTDTDPLTLKTLNPEAEAEAGFRSRLCLFLAQESLTDVGGKPLIPKSVSVSQD